MAVNVKNVAQKQAAASAPQMASSMSFGLSSKTSAFGSGGDAYEKLYTNMAEKVKFINEQTKSGEKYHVLKLLKNLHGLNYSAIIIACTLGDTTTAHILIIEKTGEYPTPLFENIAGTRYEIVRTPADALDQKYMEQAQALVAENLGVPYNKVIVVDGTLVPSEFDVNNDIQIQDIFSNGINAVDGEIAIQERDYRGINLADIINSNKNGKFFVNLYFNTIDNVVYDQAGMPIRQDICISLSYRNTTQGNQKSVNQGEDSLDLVKTYGYIDFEWTNPTMVNNMLTTQRFIPNFIITHIDAGPVPTPDILLLAIASVFTVNEDMTWLQAFKPTPGKKGDVDYNDIGALNVEGNIERSNTGYGAKVKTKVKEFGMSEFNNFVQMLIVPNLMVSIDLAKAGPNTWVTSALYHSKFNMSQGATKRIYDALDSLTNGASSTVPQVPLFTDVSNKIHGGYFRTKDGIFDLRVISSYLGLANFVAETNQPPQLITQYTNTLYNETIPTELRAAARKDFIDNISNSSAVYKQYYDRVTFSSAALRAILVPLKTTGFSPVLSNMGVSTDMFQRRSSVNFGNAMVGQDVRFLGNNNMFSNFYMPFGYNRNF